MDDSSLHENGILYDSSALHNDAAEQKRILNGALNFTAVGEKGVVHFGVGPIDGGNVVADLCGDGSLLGKEGVAFLTVQELHADFVVGLDRVDDFGETGGLIADDLQIVHVGLKEITAEGVLVVGRCILDEVLQKRLPHKEDVERVVDLILNVATDGDVGDPLVLVHGENHGVAKFRGLAVLVDDCDVGAGGVVLVKQVVKVNVVDCVGVGHDDIFLSCVVQKVQVAHEGVNTAVPGAGACQGVVIRGKKEHSLSLAGQVPWLSGTHMVHEGLIVVLGDNSHAGHSRVDHAGEREVNETVTAAKRNRCHGADAGQLDDVGVIHLRMDYSEYIICSHR